MATNKSEIARFLDVVNGTGLWVVFWNSSMAPLPGGRQQFTWMGRLPLTGPAQGQPPRLVSAWRKMPLGSQPETVCACPEARRSMHRPSFLEPFSPSVEGVLRQPLSLAELLHGHPATLLRSDSFGPLASFRVGRPFLDDTVAHDTTMPRWPVHQEERFTRRLRRSL